MKTVLVPALLAAILHAPDAGAAANLGRLFFTPQQREDLDRRRAANAQEAAAVVQESTLSLQGQVTRAGGKTTTWLNGVPHHDAYGGIDPARAAIRTGPDEPEVELKVGETFDRVRGETRNGLGGGQLTVQKSRSPAR